MEVTAIGPRPPPSASKTTDSQAQTQTRTAKAPSYIPLFSPKPTRNPAINSTLPSSLSVPHLGLVPPNRTPSGSGPPPQAAVPPPSPSSAHVSGGTSLPSLRALRNFLPFSAAKPVSSAAVPGPLKNPFLGFTPGRRSSVTIERKNSGQFPREADGTDVAVISISPPPSQPNAVDIPLSADAQEPSHPSAPAFHGELGPPVVTFKPEPPLSTELSTILESDLSGLSKHLPALDESRTSDLSGNGDSIKSEAPPSPRMDELVPPDASVLDLSTSQLKEEVMHALKEKTSRNGWLTGVVVEDVDSRPPSRNDQEELEVDGGVEPEESLHLDALDSDLAALLGPNRRRGQQPTFENPFASTFTPQQPQPIAPPRIFPPVRAVTPQSRPSPLASSPVEASPSSTTGSTRSQTSPVRTQAYPSLARGAPTRFMPRFVRSVTDRATPVSGERSIKNIARAPSDSALPLDDVRRLSIDNAYPRRSPASPLPLDFQPPPLPPPQPQHANTETHRRVAPSRLATPARFGAHTSATSRLLRSALPSSKGLPSSWGSDSPSPISRAPSAAGSAVDRLIRPRTSEDGTLEGRPTARERLGYTSRNRNRSLSVGGGNSERVASPGPRTTEWLGPRTAKAFAAAGLLDHDPNSSGSRFGSVRSLGDRDQRALAPSRVAMSEAGFWRSVSRAMTYSETATGHDSASTSTGAPRTNRSAESTAPTSISLSRPQSRTPSPQHKNYQVAIQALQEKHATETGTLLAALADAQHNAQSLRAENAKLVERIEDLEADLVDARAQLRAHQYSATPPSSSSHLQPPLLRGGSVFNRMERQASADATAMTTKRRPTLPISIPGHAQGSSRVMMMDHHVMRLEDADDENPTYHHTNNNRHHQGGGGRPVSASASASRRGSGSESVFAMPPPNMSMLLQELPAGSRRSVGSVSMTTAASAPTDAPGSPRSLFLRPEHEMHLGDLGSLDMRFTEDEADDAVDDDSPL